MIDGFRADERFEPLAVLFKRVDNILAKATETLPDRLDEARLAEPMEQELAAALERARERTEPLWGRRDYEAILPALLETEQTIHGFFDAVLVNAEDRPTRLNRLRLLSEVRGAVRARLGPVEDRGRGRAGAVGDGTGGAQRASRARGARAGGPCPAGSAGESPPTRARAGARRPPRRPAPAPGEPGPGHWFYQGLPYGSDAMTHPLRLIVDGGFGIMQFDSRSNRLDDVDFERGWNRVWDDMTNPARAIEHRRLVGLDPARGPALQRQQARRAVLAQLHAAPVGGGMTYVMVREWYAQHAIAHPHGPAPSAPWPSTTC